MFKDVILEEWGNITAETKKTSSFHAETRYRNFAEKASKLQATKNGPLFYVIYLQIHCTQTFACTFFYSIKFEMQNKM